MIAFWAKNWGGVDSSNQFERARRCPKITGIAGDVIEQSVFGYARDSRQECDIDIDGTLTELKTTGVRIPRRDLESAHGKTGDAYNALLGAKEGISITGVTFDPAPQLHFLTSHFWEKAEHLLIVFYEYKSADVVPAAAYADFPVVGWCFNHFTPDEQAKLRADWELVRDHLTAVYSTYSTTAERYAQLEGFTHRLRPQLLLIELVPGFKQRPNGSWQKPRYRLKQTLVDHIVRGYFARQRADHRTKREAKMDVPFSSFRELDERCHALRTTYGGMTLAALQKMFGIRPGAKNAASLCVLRMLGAGGTRLNAVADFVKTGIIAKTITLNARGHRTEDMKMDRVDFTEWADRDTTFDDSGVCRYFREHSLLCPVFRELAENDAGQTTFEGMKRFSFDEHFIETEVRRTWADTRHLIHHNLLRWETVLDGNGQPKRNPSGSLKGAPNLPKSTDHTVFMRGGAATSADACRTETVNGIRMLPQFFWLKGTYVAERLQAMAYL